MSAGPKWNPGTVYGPVLSQTDLYLLNIGQNTTLELNPILEGKLENNHLQFHLVTGFSVTAPATAPRAPNDILGKEEPATLPRVNQLILISRLSPWCTVIKRETGVTIGDICSTLYKEYTENDVTDPEFASLNGRAQDHVKRVAAQHFQESQGQAAQAAWGYYPPAAPDRVKRVDWLRDRVYFEGLSRDDTYVKSRLGYKAPNIFVMDLTS